MKIFILIFIVTVIGNENTGGACADTRTIPSRFTPHAVIHQIFELLRNLIRAGSTEHDIDVLDPYDIHSGNFNLDDEIFRFNMNITNGILYGLGGFHLQQFNFSKTEVALEFHIKWPLITFYSEYYDIEGKIKNAIPLSGHGVLDLELHTFELWGKMYWKPSIDGRSILIDTVKQPHFSINKVKSHTDIDGNIDTIFNAMVEDLLPGYLTRFSKFLAARYSDSIIQKLNPILEKFHSWSIITPIL